MSAVALPIGLPGINTFSTSDWWSRAVSTSGSGGAPQHRVDQPGDAVVLTADGQAPDEPSAVLMITRPLIDWLPNPVSDEAAPDPANKLTEWADAVLAWSGFAPVQMVITRADPEGLVDLRAAVAGRWAVANSNDHNLSPEAEAFGAAMHRWLRERRGWSADLDHLRSRAAIEAVAMATAQPVGAYGDDLRRASIDVRDRLISAGVQIHGPRTGLVLPARSAPDLPLDVAAEASLAVILSALDDPNETTADSSDLKAAAALLATQLQTARRELSGRRSDPRNLKRVPVRSLLKLIVLGRRHD